MEIPIANFIHIDRDYDTPIFLQIAGAVIAAVQSGVLGPGSKLPGTRELAIALGVHRNTVVAAFDELTEQGWTRVSPPHGTFVSDILPEKSPIALPRDIQSAEPYPAIAGYAVPPNPVLNEVELNPTSDDMLEFDEGFPDVRIAPIVVLNRAYRNVAKRLNAHHFLQHTDVRGNRYLRTVLSEELRTTRGLSANEENIFITRGSQMARYLTINALIAPGDQVIVGDTNLFRVNNTLLNAKARLVFAPVDVHGLNVDAIESICAKKHIRAIFVMPHFHYPTTVTLNAERRLQLLALAERRKICIIEDDYDFDFHYTRSPILPMASADHQGMVVYIGSLFKSIAPAFRIGYIAAPTNVIDEVIKLRRIIDIQSGTVLEQAVAELMHEGEIHRHLKKAHREYHIRRDVLATALRNALGDAVEFNVPDGGMALWVRFNKKYSLPQIAVNAREKGLVISNGLQHNTAGKMLNGTRLGFTSLNARELERATNILADVVRKL